MGFDADGKILAFHVDTVANIGAYVSLFATVTPTYLYGTLWSGQYDMPAIYGTVRAVHTNTAPVDAYRGAGRPEATYMIERMMETAARELGMDPAELRRKNFIREFPYQTQVLLTYDAGDFDAILDMAQAAANVKGFPERKAEAAARGKLRGLGYSTFIEACGLAPSAAVGSLGAGVGLWESAEVRVNPVGTIEILTGAHSHGQGHETTFAQLASDRFGVPIDNVSIVHGDTDKVQFGMGTYGSRSGPVGMSAVMKALDKVEAKVIKIGAHLLEEPEDKITIEDGQVKASGTNKSLDWHEIGLAAYTAHNLPEGMEPGLKEGAFFDPVNFSFPSGCFICEVEVDGGVTQGIGQALLEHAIYTEDGQLVTGSYMDYAMPRADDVPSYTIKHGCTPSPNNPLGLKGCGEAGAIGSPPAVINAITDAIGNNDLSMPATPSKVWALVQSSGAKIAAE